VNTTSDTSTSTGPDTARAFPDQVHTPDDLPPLHRQLLELADLLAGRDTGTPIGQGEADRWTTAAGKVDHLWETWRHRTHATAAQESMRHAATQAVHALREGLLGGDWREAHRWFDIAVGWIDQLKMQADYQALPRPLTAPADPTHQPRGLAALLFGRRRTPTTNPARTR
jgi:hypothetical protein